MQGAPFHSNRFRLERFIYEEIDPVLIASQATPVPSTAMQEEIAQRKIRVLKNIFERQQPTDREPQPSGLYNIIVGQHQSLLPPNKYIPDRSLQSYRKREAQQFGQQGTDIFYFAAANKTDDKGNTPLATAGPAADARNPVQPSPRKKSTWTLSKPVEGSQPKEYELFGMVRQSPNHSAQASTFTPSQTLNYPSILNFAAESNNRLTSVLEGKNFNELEVCQSNKFNEEQILKSANKNKEVVDVDDDVVVVKPDTTQMQRSPFDKVDIQPAPSLFSQPENSKIFTGPDVKLNIGANTASLFSNPVGTPPKVVSNLPALTTNAANLFSNPVAPPAPALGSPNIQPQTSLFGNEPQKLIGATTDSSKEENQKPLLFTQSTNSQEPPKQQKSITSNTSLFGNFGHVGSTPPGIIPAEVKAHEKPQFASLFPSQAPKSGLERFEQPPLSSNVQTPHPTVPKQEQEKPQATLFPQGNNIISAKPSTSLFGNMFPAKASEQPPATNQHLNIFGTPIAAPNVAKIAEQQPGHSIQHPPNKSLFGEGNVKITASPLGILGEKSATEQPPKLFLPNSNLFNQSTGKNVFESMKSSAQQPTNQNATMSLQVKQKQPSSTQETSKPVLAETPKPAVQTQAPAAPAKGLFDTPATNIFGKPLQTSEDSQKAGFAQFKTGSSLFANVPQNNIFSNPASSFPSGNTSLFGQASANNPYVFGGTPVGKAEEDDEGQDDGDDVPLEEEEKTDPKLSTGSYVYESLTETVFKSEANHFRRNSNSEVFREVIVSLEKTISTGSFNVVIRLPKTNVVTYQGLVVAGKTQIDYMNNNHQNVKLTMVISKEAGKPQADLLKIQFREVEKGEEFYSKMVQATKPQ